MYATHTKKEEHLSSLKKTLKNNYIMEIKPDSDFEKMQILEQLEGLMPKDKFETLLENLK